MYVCKVIGKIVSTTKDSRLTGASLVLVRVASLSPEGGIALGREIYGAVDTIGCGEGSLVLVTGGSNARFACKNLEAPADMAVVGIIDNDLLAESKQA